MLLKMKGANYSSDNVSLPKHDDMAYSMFVFFLISTYHRNKQALSVTMKLGQKGW